MLHVLKKKNITKNIMENPLAVDNLKKEKRKAATISIAKLIWLGLFLPNIDFVTDAMAIYQHWKSSQWVLNYLARVIQSHTKSSFKKGGTPF